jgi:chromosome segregation ATPase
MAEVDSRLADANHKLNEAVREVQRVCQLVLSEASERDSVSRETSSYAEASLHDQLAKLRELVTMLTVQVEEEHSDAERWKEELEEAKEEIERLTRIIALRLDPPKEKEAKDWVEDAMTQIESAGKVLKAFLNNTRR